MGSARWWCEYAWLPPGKVESAVLIEVGDTEVGDTEIGAGRGGGSGRGTRIRTVTVGTGRPPPGVPALRGLVIPGLANVHSHAFHRALRARTQAAAGSFWTWRDQMYAAAATLTPDLYRALARAVYAEMALAGITAVGEFHYLHHQPGGVPYADPNEMGLALADAATGAGLRLTMLDACYLTGGIGRPLSGAQLRFGDGDAGRWAERAEALTAALGDRPGIEVGAAVHSIRAVPPEAAAKVAEWASAHDAPLHVHLSEQTAENSACWEAYGRTPTGVLADANVLGERTTAIHGTHLAEHDLRQLGAAGAGVCLCPTTERDLADGIGPAAALIAAEVPVSLGSDSHAVIDLLEEARAVELDERLAQHSRGRIGAPMLLDAATRFGHRALGRPDAGRLAVGAPADLVAVRLDSVRTAGCGPSAETVVFAASAADVTDVIIDGRPVVAGGRHLLVEDVPSALAVAIAAVRADALAD